VTARSSLIFNLEHSTTVVLHCRKSLNMPTTGELVVGVSTGLIQTFLFNPIDRALYLHIVENTSFLAKSNWSNPYHGVFNALSNRVIQYGFYYNIVDWYLQIVNKHFPNLGHNPSRVLTGVATGVTTAVFLNPISCVKYHAWGTELKLIKVSKEMYKEAGLHSFTRGLGSIALRDSVFSVLYLVGKRYSDEYSTNNKIRFLTNSLVACVATIVTAPINYVRSMKYASGYKKENPSPRQIFKDLLEYQTKYTGTKDVIPILKYYSHRLALGWGTLRVGVGIASGQYIFDSLTISIGRVIDGT
jgi:hypothetical protein